MDSSGEQVCKGVSVHGEHRGKCAGGECRRGEEGRRQQRMRSVQGVCKGAGLYRGSVVCKLSGKRGVSGSVQAGRVPRRTREQGSGRGESRTAGGWCRACKGLKERVGAPGVWRCSSTGGGHAHARTGSGWGSPGPRGERVSMQDTRVQGVQAVLTLFLASPFPCCPLLPGLVSERVPVASSAAPGAGPSCV